MEALRRIKKDGLESFEIVHVPAEVTCMIRNMLNGSIAAQMSTEDGLVTAFTTWTADNKRNDWWDQEKALSIKAIEEFDPVVFFISEKQKQDMEKQLRALLSAGCSMHQIRKFLDKSYVEYVDKYTLPPAPKKLTAAVFDMSECPKWAKYAAVNSDGDAFWFEDKPFLTFECGTWVIETKYMYTRIPALFDSTDWENSVIQKPEPVKELTMEELEKHFGCKVKIKKAD